MEGVEINGEVHEVHPWASPPNFEEREKGYAKEKRRSMEASKFEQQSGGGLVSQRVRNPRQ
jgi:hypothetical protein